MTQVSKSARKFSLSNNIHNFLQDVFVKCFFLNAVLESLPSFGLAVVSEMVEMSLFLARALPPNKFTSLTVTSLLYVSYRLAHDMFSPFKSRLANCIIFIMFGSLSNKNSSLSCSNVRLQSSCDDVGSC